jgi:hypothetical protein
MVSPCAGKLGKSQTSAAYCNNIITIIFYNSMYLHSYLSSSSINLNIRINNSRQTCFLKPVSKSKSCKFFRQSQPCQVLRFYAGYKIGKWFCKFLSRFVVTWLHKRRLIQSNIFLNSPQ